MTRRWGRNETYSSQGGAPSSSSSSSTPPRRNHGQRVCYHHPPLQSSSVDNNQPLDHQTGYDADDDDASLWMMMMRKRRQQEYQEHLSSSAFKAPHLIYPHPGMVFCFDLPSSLSSFIHRRRHHHHLPLRSKIGPGRMAFKGSQSAILWALSFDEEEMRTLIGAFIYLLFSPGNINIKLPQILIQEMR